MTVVRAGSHVRIACNRDERVARPAALPPAPIAIGGRRVIMPVDPEGFGTWIAATEAGVVFTLLNVNGPADEPADSYHSARRSRGLIIPRLARCSTADEAIANIRGRTWTAFAPFRLLVVSHDRLGEALWNGRRLTTRRGRLRTPLMRTSSGLGDGLVQGPRNRLFRRMVRGRTEPRVAQDRFHSHVWPGRPHLSVLMSRPGARTVSRTIVELSATRAVMTYTARPR